MAQLPKVQEEKLKVLINRDDLKAKFTEVLGKKAPAFITSILGVQNSSEKLLKSDPMSIISAAMVAATLDLPINQNLGYAYIVPYRSRQDDGTYKDIAQFQMGWKGYVQLAMRTGQYRTINVSEVYEGELISENRLTGEIIFDCSKKISDKIIGYVAYFKMLNGFSKMNYMTRDKADAHGKRYSQTYKNGFGQWKDDFDSMAKKTVVKLLLSKWGMLSTEMQRAIENDSAVIDEAGNKSYADNEFTDAKIVSENPLAPKQDATNIRKLL